MNTQILSSVPVYFPQIFGTIRQFKPYLFAFDKLSLSHFGQISLQRTNSGKEEVYSLLLTHMSDSFKTSNPSLLKRTKLNLKVLAHPSKTLYGEMTCTAF